jgi:hypothetical protein
MKNVTSSPVTTYLRLPLLVLAGVLCMGSGLGNPGCGSGSSGDSNQPACKGKCAVEGTYQLTFEDTSPLAPGCQELGLSLPTGPLVISRDDAELSTRLNGLEVTGNYFGTDHPETKLRGDGTARTPSGATVPITVLIEATFEPQPDDTTQPSVLKGLYEVYRTDKEYDVTPCKGFRAFTATR